ncbi:hypothetical protein [Ornithinimicrobium cryptoxanthini]|uniref:Transmembrane protein n=1 Tax=Ornithinimicrobium cryptoxanthini TaxID=2934161 RepID=A0ABY4YJ89_9MICO|nr:hypothetical protein [Ornithinimicrobium cryptoxanthini]USQ76575.1 hypothetical protein NF557_01185 [Ornithinimicrobium cryptoxanthini]
MVADEPGAPVLALLGGLLWAGGVITLCVGVTRLVAKADVAYAARAHNGSQ